jgi:hypothetical protein
MTDRVRCPYEPQAKRGVCERNGCNHYAANRARICRCCLAQLPSELANKLSLMCQMANDLAVLDAEQDKALATLNATEPRKVFGRRWKPTTWQ